MKEILKIDFQNDGLITDTDEHQIVDEIQIVNNIYGQTIKKEQNYFVDSLNLNPNSSSGQVETIKEPGKTDNLSSYDGAEIRQGVFIEQGNSSTYIFNSSSSEIKAIRNFPYNTYWEGTSNIIKPIATDGGGTVFIPNNKEVHIGRGKNVSPLWAGFNINTFGKYYSTNVTNYDVIPDIDFDYRAGTVTEDVIIRLHTAETITEIKANFISLDASNGTLTLSNPTNITVNGYIKFTTGSIYYYFTNDNESYDKSYTYYLAGGVFHYEIIGGNIVVQDVILESHFDNISASQTFGFSVDTVNIPPDKYVYQIGSNPESSPIFIKANTWVEIPTTGIYVNFLKSNGYATNQRTKIVYAGTSDQFISEKATLETPKYNSLNIAEGVKGEKFSKGKKYWYAYSIEYDGYQYSPLYYNNEMIVAISSLQTDSYDSIDINIEFDKDNLSKRMTGIAIFSSETDLKESTPGQFSLIKVIHGYYDENSTDNYISITLKDTKEYLNTYEELTGISQNIENFTPNYTIATQLNGYLFVANSSIDGIDGAEYYIFRSKLGKFDTFDTSIDFLRLPLIPHQIQAFDGKIFAFFNNKIIKINPDLFIEETWEGIGIKEGLMPLICNLGMIWYDSQGIYHAINNKEYTKISNNIYSKLQSVSFFDLQSTGIQYSKHYNSIFFSVYTGYFFAYNFIKKTWYFISLIELFQTLQIYNFFTNKNGNLYISGFFGIDNEVYQLFSGNNYLTGGFTTKKYDLGEDSQYKKWYRVNTRGGGHVFVNVSFDGGISIPITNPSILKTKAKYVNYECEFGGGDPTKSYIKSIEHLVRTMVGRR